MHKRIWQTYVVVGRATPGSDSVPDAIRDKLDLVSAAGWELVAASHDEGHHHLFFRAATERKPSFDWRDS